MRTRKERDLRTDEINISLPTLLRKKRIKRAETSSFNPKR
jgi:hypothetical protein